MEKSVSVEEKIRRAEEIYNKRQQLNAGREINRINVNTKKDYKLFKKMFIQILICCGIYFLFNFLVSNNYVFSEDLRNSISNILNYDFDFKNIYIDLKDKFTNFVGIPSNQTQENTTTEENITEDNVIIENQAETSNEENIGGAEDKAEQTVETPEETAKELSQMEQDALDIKNSISFIVPVAGTISSIFGWRNPTTSSVPKYHTGLDIAAVQGIKIKSATDGTVILNSSEGDYGKHLKIQINDVVIIYAHCKTLYVKEGEQVKQGQEIAEVGSTGNSTGPHLHFEIRKQDRLVDPQLIIQI